MRRQRATGNGEDAESDPLLANLLPPMPAGSAAAGPQLLAGTFLLPSFVPACAFRSQQQPQAQQPWSALVEAIIAPTRATDPQARERRAPTGLAYHSDCAAHMPPRHPFAGECEIPERATFTFQHLLATGLVRRCVKVPVVEATGEQLYRVHDPTHVLLVNSTATHGMAGMAAVRPGGDLYANESTARAARLAAGGVTEAALRVARGELTNALCVVRPPGHHCSATRASGFCFFNNVAVAARAAQAEVARVRAAAAGGAAAARGDAPPRILIVDWDVHHGDGTESVFYDDPSVLVISVHQHGLGKGHVFHRPAPLDMPGVRMSRRRGGVEGAFQQRPPSGATAANYVGGGKKPQEAKKEEATVDSLLALLDDDNNTGAEAAKPDKVVDQPMSLLDDHVDDNAPVPAQQVKKSDENNGTYSARRVEVVPPPPLPPQNERQERAKRVSKPVAASEDDDVNDDEIMRMFGLKEGTAPSASSSSSSAEQSQNTSSLDSQHLPSSGSDDDEDEDDSADEEADEENESASDFWAGNSSDSSSYTSADKRALRRAAQGLEQGGGSGGGGRPDEVEFDASPIESHTGRRFHRGYKPSGQPFYPGTGFAERVGGRFCAAAVGRNINVPWPCTEFGDVEYLRVMHDIVLPAAKEFAPDLILISSGIDCADGDLLGDQRVTPTGFFLMTSLLSEQVTDKVVVALEGGYMLRNVALGCEAILRALLQYSGTPVPSASFPTPAVTKTATGHVTTGTTTRRSTMLFDQCTQTIERVRSIHSPYWDCFQQQQPPPPQQQQH